MINLKKKKHDENGDGKNKNTKIEERTAKERRREERSSLGEVLWLGRSQEGRSGEVNTISEECLWKGQGR